jgi:hypothetical protein
LLIFALRASREAGLSLPSEAWLDGTTGAKLRSAPPLVEGIAQYMKTKLMRPSLTTQVFATLFAGVVAAEATLVDWQNQVMAGAQPSTTIFTTVSGTAPELIDVGPLSGDSTFEFIVNAGDAGLSSAFLGNRDSNGRQGLKFDQWQDSGVMGITNFGVVDILSDDAPPLFTDTHVVFVSDGVDTNLYVNGTNVFTFVGVPLTIFGEQGLAGVYNSGGNFNDVLDGNILGFASYDSALSPAEIATHSQAFAIPEPSTCALAALAGVGMLARRRRQLA